ncbi:phosphatase PAP2 family protein [Nocardioides sp. SYSU DS0651]|uniref:phosphatase PAP2 family protein n=1 Tax=Nocardioides sp. SYSU DS0651 TaxID=3415955 RepID=UPI003F4B3DF1
MGKQSSAMERRRSPDGDGVEDQLATAGRFGARSVAGWLAVVMAVLPVLVLWLLIRDSDSGVVRLDQSVVADLNEAVHDSDRAIRLLETVTDLAGTWVSVLVFTATTLFLALRRRLRPALFVAATAIGLAVLIPVSKAIVGRVRPVVENPVTETPVNDSFPSGHAMTAVVLWGTIAVLTAPALGRRGRALLGLGWLALVGLIGFTRLALGVHFLSDVLAGWALGLAWLAAMVVAFGAWPGARTSRNRPGGTAGETVGRHRSDAGRRVAALVLAAVTVAGALVALGQLLAGPGADSAVVGWDRAVVDALVERRTDALTAVADAARSASSAAAVIAGSITVCCLAFAATRRWDAVWFVLAATLGETALYYVVSRTVGRERPEVPDLTSGLPDAASWPSGHVAAAVALYGAAAVLCARRWSPTAGRIGFVLAAVIVLAVASSSIYVGAHYPTDVVAGLLLGSAWLLACERLALQCPPSSRPSTTPRRNDHV